MTVSLNQKVSPCNSGCPCTISQVFVFWRCNSSAHPQGGTFLECQSFTWAHGAHLNKWMAVDVAGGRLRTYHTCFISGERRPRDPSPIQLISYPQSLSVRLEASPYHFTCLRILQMRLVCSGLEGTYFSKATRPPGFKDAVSARA
jgi:hypothetical protein